MRKGIFFILLSLFAVSLAAQDYSQLELPNDSDIRIGQLDNGMTYYIAKNKKPEGMANYYIVHNVGAMQEEEHQNGLAHFLEHMAFNGTKNFPDKNLLEYLETIGVQFGRNVNAYTSQEETVYMLMDVPTVRETIIDSALLILNDWSHYISLVGEEIDKERGVILEELRTGQGAQRRIFNKISPTYFNHTKFAERNVIGTEELLKTFKHDDIREFYHDWYRPDNQAVIIVGDFDIDKVEEKAKELFSQIPTVENAKELEYTPVPNYKEDEVLIVSDPEQTYNLAMVVIPIETIPLELNSTIMAKAVNTNYSMMSAMINERLTDLSKSLDAPFVQASVYVGSRTRHQDAFIINVVPKDADFEPAIDAVMQEIVRVRKYGFTESALERVKANLLKRNEERYANRESRKNSEIVSAAMANFMSNVPILDQEVDYEMTKNFINVTTVDIVNEMIGTYAPEVPAALIVIATEKDVDSLDGESLLKAYQTSLKAEVEPLEEDIIDRPLISEEPVAGKIVEESTDKYGNTVFKLSNGAEVIITTTDHKKDELLFRATKQGGESLLAEEDVLASALMSSVTSISGVGEFSANDLKKMLAGKSLFVSYSIDLTKLKLSGRSSVSDLETFAQVIYLTYTSPRFTEDDLDVFKKRVKPQFDNLSIDPHTAYSDSLAVVTYGNSPRITTTEQLVAGYNDITVEQLQNMHKTMFNGADGMKFYFVGNVTADEFKPLIEKYIASIPKGELTPYIAEATPQFIKGSAENVFVRKQENPKASVAVVLNVDDFDYTLENLVAFEALKHVLNIRYTEVIREEKGATYGVQLSASTTKEPDVTFTLTAQFDTSGDMAEETAEIIISEIEKIANEGAIEIDVHKAKETFLKNFKNAQKENASRLSWNVVLTESGLDYLNDYEAAVNSIDSDKVKEMAKFLMSKSNRVKVIMLPE
ncbi:MAG: insulinase family protein [Rikenellaceae bacterium]